MDESPALELSLRSRPWNSNAVADAVTKGVAGFVVELAISPLDAPLQPEHPVSATQTAKLASFFLSTPSLARCKEYGTIESAGGCNRPEVRDWV